MKRVLQVWMPFAFLISFFCIVVYGAVHQNIRSAANDPQIEMIESIIQASNEDPNMDLTPLLGQAVDIKTSLAPFVIIFNDVAAPVASSAVLNGKTPIPPGGVFKYLVTHDEDNFTWQPQVGVRAAVVMRKLDGVRHGFILVGRSLREVEKRGGELGFFILVSWIVGMSITLLYSLVAARRASRKK